MTTFTALKGLALAAAAAGFVALAPVGATAAPLNPAPITAQDDAGVTQVHWRGHHRHGGWHRWHRHRHHHWHHRHHHRHYGYYPRFRSYYY